MLPTTVSPVRFRPASVSCPDWKTSPILSTISPERLLFVLPLLVMVARIASQERRTSGPLVCVPLKLHVLWIAASPNAAAAAPTLVVPLEGHLPRKPLLCPAQQRQLVLPRHHHLLQSLRLPPDHTHHHPNHNTRPCLLPPNHIIPHLLQSSPP